MPNIHELFAQFRQRAEEAEQTIAGQAQELADRQDKIDRMMNSLESYAAALLRSNDERRQLLDAASDNALLEEIDRLGAENGALVIALGEQHDRLTRCLNDLGTAEDRVVSAWLQGYEDGAEDARVLGSAVAEGTSLDSLDGYERRLAMLDVLDDDIDSFCGSAGGDSAFYGYGDEPEDVIGDGYDEMFATDVTRDPSCILGLNVDDVFANDEMVVDLTDDLDYFLDVGAAQEMSRLQNLYDDVEVLLTSGGEEVNDTTVFNTVLMLLEAEHEQAMGDGLDEDDLALDEIDPYEDDGFEEDDEDDAEFSDFAEELSAVLSKIAADAGLTLPGALDPDEAQVEMSCDGRNVLFTVSYPA